MNLLGLLVGGLMLVWIVGCREGTKDSAPGYLKHVSIALEMYREDMGDYPANGLEGLVDSKYVPRNVLYWPPSEFSDSGTDYSFVAVYMFAAKPNTENPELRPVAVELLGNSDEKYLYSVARESMNVSLLNREELLAEMSTYYYFEESDITRAPR